MNIKKYKKKFHSIGYFKVKNFLNNSEILTICNEISKAKDTIIYKDRNNLVRRIEKFYDKGRQLKIINNKFIKLIYKLLNIQFLIFKDKFNLKPPGGEGFYAHYDGIFKFIDNKNNIKNGWYEYGDFFVNVLVALDKCNSKNGTIELGKSHKNNFENLIKNTKNDGTPNLLKKKEKEIYFEKIYLKPGDIVIFKNTCPHRSKKNYSKQNRRILYYTYLPKKFGNQYNKYFKDKKLSKNKTAKALSGES